MQNIIVNNAFKQFRGIAENRNGSVVAHSGMIASFKYGYNAYSREVLSQAQVYYVSKNRYLNTLL
jgi:hypothetical protein